MEGRSLEAPPAAPRDIAWRVLDLAQASLSRLEARTLAVVAAEAAGLAVLWTQLSTFDRRAAAALAWIAWLLLIVGVIALVPYLVPRRAGQSWHAWALRDVLDEQWASSAGEADLLRRLADATYQQSMRLRRGLRVSAPLGSMALILAAAAYAIEKA